MLNKPYYSIQEMVDKTEVQRRQVEADMDAHGFFDPAETASILHGQKALIRYRLAESLRAIPMQEFLMKSGTTGVAGATYLIPDKLHDDLVFYAGETDMCPLISAQMVNGWEGGDLKVDIVNDETYIANPMISGSIASSETAETTQATVTPNSFGINIPIGGDLVEDNPHGLVEWHVRQAAKPIGKLASDYALSVLAAGADGWGTLNSASTGDTNQTKWIGGTTADITDAITAIADDEWIANTIVMMPHVWYHSVRETIGRDIVPATAGNIWKSTPMPVYAGPAAGFDFRMENLDVKLSTSPTLHGGYVRGVTDAPAAPPTLCVTLVFDRNNALLTGRKRWMRIENYSNPTRIIEGAVVSCRQDSVTLYDDAIYKLTEAGQQ
jgi:hypothetical protein